MRQPVNAMTVDVEDWIQSVHDPDAPLTDCFVRNTLRVLDLLAVHGVRATFFVLGLAAEKAPGLVREIHGAGHEVQSHGFGHRPLHFLSPHLIREDLRRSKRLLEDIIGEEVFGFRAPAFSINRGNLQVLDLLVECGYRYDSSIFPVRMRRYGIADAPWFPHRLRTPGGGEIVEVPVASLRMLGRRWPMGGGGYLRLCPGCLVREAVRQINSHGYPATIYVHPYEFAPREIAGLNACVPWSVRLHQTLGRRMIPGRVRRLLGTFPFGSLRDAVLSSFLPRHSYLAASDVPMPDVSQPIAELPLGPLAGLVRGGLAPSAKEPRDATAAMRE